MFTFFPKFAVVLMLTTLLLFMFPADSGSFTATHGPTTALRAAARFRNLLATIAAWSAAMAGVILVRAVIEKRSGTVLVASQILSLRC